ncbi:MAG: hypothetical protein ACQCN6_10830 [Candidatus Bathyarchaeia archaeon]
MPDLRAGRVLLLGLDACGKLLNQSATRLNCRTQNTTANTAPKKKMSKDELLF